MFYFSHLGMTDDARYLVWQPTYYECCEECLLQVQCVPSKSLREGALLLCYPGVWGWGEGKKEASYINMQCQVNEHQHQLVHLVMEGHMVGLLWLDGLLELPSCRLVGKYQGGKHSIPRHMYISAYIFTCYQQLTT